MADLKFNNEDHFFEEDDQDDAPNDIPEVSRQVFSDLTKISLKQLHDQYKDGDLILQPEYQRHVVWDPKKNYRLIESVFLNFPIPVIYLAEEEDGKQTVIDGQQRLHTFFKFFDGELRLKNLMVITELNGKTYPELSKEHQRQFKNFNTPIVLVQKESHNDIRFEIFERLNTGSVKLNEQEIRNCIYRGNYNEFIKELSDNEDFQFILDNPNLHIRMLDTELILRFFAFYNKSYMKFKSPMKKFLNDEIERHNHLPQKESQKEIEELRPIFKKSVELIKTIFGKKAFRRMASGTDRDHNGGYKETIFNAGLFDVLMNGFTDYQKPQVNPYAEAIREELLWLSTNDQEFIGAISGAGTNTTEKTHKKFDIWRRALKNILGSPRNEPRCFSWELKNQLFQNNPVCAICNQRIMDIDDAEVDHIDFYWRGGATIPSNARLTHRFCNRQRGGREPNLNAPIAISKPISQNQETIASKLQNEIQSLDTIKIPTLNEIQQSSSVIENRNINYSRQIHVSKNTPKVIVTRTRGAISRKHYIFPMLEYLVQNNVSTPNEVAYQIIESKFQEDFSTIDTAHLEHDGSLRWRKNLDYAKYIMRDNGLLKNDIRSVWEITDFGREFYIKVKENPEHINVKKVEKRDIIIFESPKRTNFKFTNSLT